MKRDSGWERWGGWANCSNDAQIEEGLGRVGTISTNCTAEIRGPHRFLFQNKLHQIWECWELNLYFIYNFLSSGEAYMWSKHLNRFQNSEVWQLCREMSKSIKWRCLRERTIYWKSVKQALWWFDSVWHVGAELPSAAPPGIKAEQSKKWTEDQDLRCQSTASFSPTRRSFSWKTGNCRLQPLFLYLYLDTYLY